MFTFMLRGAGEKGIYCFIAVFFCRAFCQRTGVPKDQGDNSILLVMGGDDATRKDIVFGTKENKQNRLDVLMSKNNEGQLNESELLELQEMVREVEQLKFRNARLLAAQQRTDNREITLTWHKSASAGRSAELHFKRGVSTLGMEAMCYLAPICL